MKAHVSYESLVSALWCKLRLVMSWGGGVKSVAVLAGGTILGQGITVLVSPVLTRIYSPEDMGRLGLYLAFIGVVSVAVSLGYETGIVSANESKEAAYLVLASAVFMMPISLIAVIAMQSLMRLSLFGFGGLPSYSAVMVCPSLLMGSAFIVLRYWCVRERRFGVISKVVVLQNGGRCTLQVGLGSFSLGWAGLLLGDVLGRAIGLGPMLRSTWRSITEALLPVRRSILFKTLYGYRKCAMYYVPSALVDALGQYLPIPLIAQFYGGEAAGHVFLVQRVLSLPVALVGGSVADVFHGRIATYARQEPHRVMAFVFRTAGGLLVLGLGPLVLLTLFGQSLFGWVFGGKWSAAGLLASIMAPWALAQLVVSPLSRLLFVFQRQELKLVYDVLSLLGVISVLFVGSRWGLSLTQAVAWLSLTQVLTYAIYFLLLCVVAGRG